MKFQLTFKMPDVYDQLDPVVFSATTYIDDQHEREFQMEKMKEELTDFAGKYVSHEEYISIEFDTDNKTVKVLPTGS